MELGYFSENANVLEKPEINLEILAEMVEMPLPRKGLREDDP